MKNIVLWLCLLLMPCSSVMAQYHNSRNKIWAMGKRVGLDFSNGDPTFISTSLKSQPTHIQNEEGCASISDGEDGLQFYTNGTTVWNALGNIMPHGNDINGIYQSETTTQGALIVPVPGHLTRNYVFSVTYTTTPIFYKRLYCNVVDMAMDNGNGDVDTTFALRNVVLGDSLTEKMIAIGGCNGNVWVVVLRKTPTVCRFQAYSISSSGINLTPVISPFTPAAYDIISYTGCTMRVSPTRNRIAVAVAPGLEVFDFNPNTGEVSNRLVFDSTTFYYGCTFSPDGSKLYASKDDIVQYDLNAANPVATKVVLGPGGSYDCKLAVDSKIYFRAPPNAVGRINAPNNAGTACNYQATIPGLFIPSNSNQQLLSGLPNEIWTAANNISGEVHTTTIDTLCLVNMVLHPRFNASVFLWDNGSSGTTRAIQDTGKYWVRYVNPQCNYQVDTFIIRGQPIANAVIEKLGDTLRTTQTYTTYQWYKDNLLLPGATTRSLLATGNGLYSVRVSNSWLCADTAIYNLSGGTGIEHPASLKDRISVYPNPTTNGLLYIDAPAVLHVSLWSIEGRQLAAYGQTRSLNIRHLSKGLYLLRLSDNEGNLIKMVKIVRQ